MTIEYLDILDENGNKTGETASYDDVHRLGLRHRTVHIFLVNDKNELLLQKRSEHKKARGGYWDISAAGHVSAGQTSVEAALREAKEEIGVDFKEDEMKYLFTTSDFAKLNNGTYLDNEFNDVYAVRKNIPISDIKIDPEEVAEIRYVPLTEFLRMIDDKNSKVVPHVEEYKKAVSMITDLQ